MKAHMPKRHFHMWQNSPALFAHVSGSSRIRNVGTRQKSGTVILQLPSISDQDANLLDSQYLPNSSPVCLKKLGFFQINPSLMPVFLQQGKEVAPVKKSQWFALCELICVRTIV